MTKKRPNTAAVARAAFDSRPPPTDDAPPRKRKRSVVEEARAPPPPRPEPVRLVSANEVAARIGVTLVTLWSWSRNGKFPPPRRVGTRNIAWLSTDVDEWIRNLPMQATEGTWRR